MLKSDSADSAAVIASLRTHMGMIFRHGPYPSNGEPIQETFVCMASNLGKGIWAAVSDRGAYGGRVYD